MDTLCPYSPPPLEPPLRGPPMREAGSQRKGAGGQRTGLRSITAAAELSVTFRDCSYRWKARLCVGGAQVVRWETAGGSWTRPYGQNKATT